MNPWPNPVALSIVAPAAGVAVVNTNTGAFAATLNSFVPVDPSLGPTRVLLPIPLPTTDLAIVMIGIIKAGGGTFPTTVVAQGGGIQVYDPSWNGQGAEYGGSGVISTDAKAVFSFVFLKSVNLWVPGN